MRSNIRPLLLPGPNAPPAFVKTVYDVLGVVFTVLALNFLAAPFITLNLDDSLTVWSNLNWYGLFIIFGPIVFFWAGGNGYFKDLQTRRGIVSHPKKTTAITVEEPALAVHNKKNRDMKLGLDTSPPSKIGDFAKQTPGGYTPGGSTRTPGSAVTPGTPFFVPSISKTQEELERLVEDATGVVQGFGEGTGYYNR